MNTLEINNKHKINSWTLLYSAAYKQFVAYEKIEGIDWKKYDFSIDCAEDQMKFKDMLQIRFIEELTEATMALKMDGDDHFREELSDAINFFLSAYIMLGVHLENMPKPVKGSFYNLQVSFYSIIERVGWLCNLLKNRPWAQSNYLVSMTDFNDRLMNLWIYFWGVILNLITEEDIFDLFERKYEVNKWRIKTGY